jgi:hypothetical protein
MIACGSDRHANCLTHYMTLLVRIFTALLLGAWLATSITIAFGAEPSPTGPLRIAVYDVPPHGYVSPKGSISIGAITITPEREKRVDFSYPAHRSGIAGGALIDVERRAANLWIAKKPQLNLTGRKACWLEESSWQPDSSLATRSIKHSAIMPTVRSLPY